jgi:prophage antirepressor-like protein
MSASSLKTSSASETSEVIIYTFENQPFRVVGSLDKPQFVVKDICDILGISNATNAVRNIPEEWHGDLYQIKDTIGRLQHMNTVYESGLYYLVMRSDKEVAKPFQKWVCGEVLTSLRKKGEYVLQEYKAKLETQQKLNEEQKLLLEKKEAENKKQEQRIRLLEKKTLRSQTRIQYKERNVIYMVQDEYHKKTRTYVIGKAIDLTERLSDYNKTREFEVAYYRECNSAQQMTYIEKNVLLKLDKYREVKNRDRFILPEGQDVSLFTNIIDLFVDAFKDVDPNAGMKEDLESEDEKENKSEYNKCYREDNKEIINEYNKNYNEEHKEEISEKNKIYREENKEKLSEQKKNYYQENKEQLALKNKIYREENKEELAAKDKKYYEENKDKELLQKKKYYAEKKEEIIEKSKKYYKENKEKVAERKRTYREANKEKLEEKRKENYQKNKDKILRKKQEKILCNCGLTISKSHLARHFKTQTHQNFLKHKQNEQSIIDTLT